MRKINVFDTTLRDGEQSPGVNLNTQEKLAIAKQLERLGADIIEAGFPASSRGDFLAVQEIARTIKNCSVTGLARCVKGDIDAAWEALKDGAYPRIHVFIATSDIHLKHKLNMTREQVIARAVEMVKYAKERFPVVQWSAEDACRTELPFLAEIVEKVIDAGASVINLPDTVGYLAPAEYGNIFKYMKENVSNIHQAKLSAHCHDDLGMAVANSLAAIESGADQIECAVNGIGERAGNAALEEIAVALHIRKDFYQVETGITMNEIKRTSDLVSKLTGMAVPRNKAVVGDNAFAHESGIHQDGFLKEKTTYEIISPELVGVTADALVLGKHSGRHAFKDRLTALGFQFDSEEINKFFTMFKELTEKKKEITDEDLVALILEEKVTDRKIGYEFLSLQVHYGTSQVPTATLSLKNQENAELIQEAATGAGSVEAIYNTLERCIDKDVELLDYRIQSNRKGEDAFAQVYVRVVVNGKESAGRGIAQDVLEASAKAYLNAVNRQLVFQSNMSGLKNHTAVGS
ncbi:2-isopropylmalate synthase [Bacillus vallismortis]|uniref:2-isopropylmalate synthase n=1 Tax=Bacillus vallismortis TaxID=72361 RepID=UPI0002880831|nr:2-isopropylmalate synthase [Bacillus vallismortis]MBG9771103.1 2-isopropylmalate synthase [Bacillus vallismortis]MCY7893462.1 2-isopropylmalate synthase [Bacillus vallismortis]MCY8423482.1 2-isopropylmalate synthase [Bacillus vallismortis]MCY8596408.1 2-isopropylmalate synthase [Bacillus vallismortis]MEC1269079.1 2-isopropylmalate synthase [Bacillus vallismortis]